jgi:4a-hydroxytetrahydrobiopterin dehydratase
VSYEEGDMKLLDQTCKPRDACSKLLSYKEAEELMPQIPSWSLHNKEIDREFRFKDFRQAVDFVNQVAAVANDQDHHPDIFISYNKVNLTLSTHKAGGLTMNDLILAAKIDLLTGAQHEKAA